MADLKRPEPGCNEHKGTDDEKCLSCAFRCGVDKRIEAWIAAQGGATFAADLRQDHSVAAIADLVARAEKQTATAYTSIKPGTDWRARAEQAEAKLAQIADLVNFHGMNSNYNSKPVIVLDQAHLTKILNGDQPTQE